MLPPTAQKLYLPYPPWHFWSAFQVKQPVTGTLSLQPGCAFGTQDCLDNFGTCTSCGLYEPDFRSTTGDATLDAQLAASRKCQTATHNP